MLKVLKKMSAGLLLSLLVLPQAIADETQLSGYLLGSGDLINIHVFEEEGLTLETRLSDAGTISYPFLGEIKAGGLRIGELTALVKTGLSDGYLLNPVVSITVLEYRQFYINGEVEEPGGYAYLPGLTLQKAVALAGGFTERASREKIFVIHDDSANEVPEKINLASPVRPGDVVTIEESFF